MSPDIESQPSGIDSLESIPGLLKRLQIRALDNCFASHCNLHVLVSCHRYVIIGTFDHVRVYITTKNENENCGKAVYNIRKNVFFQISRDGLLGRQFVKRLESFAPQTLLLGDFQENHTFLWFSLQKNLRNKKADSTHE
jgi:hypothetical protein